MAQTGNCAALPEGADLLTHGTPGWVDAWQDSEGRITLLAHHKVWRTQPKGTGWREDAAFPAAPGTPTLALDRKFREGTLWRRSGQVIERWEGARRRWVAALAAPCEFADFEILQGGDVVLVGTPETLLQVHAPQNVHPLAQVPYPDLGLSAPDRTFTDWWAKPRTYAENDRLLLYFPRSGRLFLWDAIARALRTLDTPWPALDGKGFRARLREGHLLNLSDIPGAGCFQVIPLTPGKVGLAFQVRPFETGVVLDEKGAIKKVLPRTFAEKDPGGPQTALLDLDTGSITHLRKHPGLGFPLWMLSESDVVPLASLLQGLKLKAPAPKGEKTEP